MKCSIFFPLQGIYFSFKNIWKLAYFTMIKTDAVIWASDAR